MARAKEGDVVAANLLVERAMPRLRRWARGRLPACARDLVDTDDVVQDTFIKVMARLESFEPEFDGAFHAYLRQAVGNRIRDEIRRAVRRPSRAELPEDHEDGGLTPLEHAIGREAVARYEAALQKLKPRDREAIVGRVELQYSYDELALVLDTPTSNAARVAVTRALARLVDVMAE